MTQTQTGRTRQIRLDGDSDLGEWPHRGDDPNRLRSSPSYRRFACIHARMAETRLPKPRNAMVGRVDVVDSGWAAQLESAVTHVLVSLTLRSSSEPFRHGTEALRRSFAAKLHDTVSYASRTCLCQTTSSPSSLVVLLLSLIHHDLRRH